MSNVSSSLSSSTFLIVGDRFGEFRKSAEGVRLASEVLASPEAFSGANLLPGQGLSDEELRALGGEVRRASREATHKRDERNIMISEPRKSEGDRYEADLLVDDGCAEMSDHVTGLHLQGMVLVEAARQTLVAVTERFLLPQPRAHGYSFVFERMDTRFLEFGFPFGARVELEVLGTSARGDLAFKFQVQVRVMQAGRELFRMDADYSVMMREYLEFKESQMARQGLARLRAGA